MKRNIYYLSAVILAGVLLCMVARSCNRNATPAADPVDDRLSPQNTISARAQGGTNDIAKEVAVPMGKDATHGLRKLAPGEKRSWAVEKAMFVGAEGMVTVHVVDTTGTPVPDAIIEGNFFCSSKSNDGFRTRTDGMGVVALSGTVSDELNIAVSKNGYYQSTLAYWFYKDGYECLRDGRWLPWDPTLEIVLKKKRKPVRLIGHNVLTYIPESDKPVGYDCLVNDWVRPFGTGNSADLFFAFSSIGGWQGRVARHYTNELIISAGDIPGILVESHDSWSQLQSCHEAPLDGYSAEARLTAKAFTPYQKDDILDDLFLRGRHIVFRSRAVTNAVGEVVSAHYGKIYPQFVYSDAPPEKGAAGLAFTYYFNLELNDRNLEFEDSYGFKEKLEKQGSVPEKF